MTSTQPIQANRAWRAAALALIAAVALAACGQVDTGAGQAAQVGNDTLTVQTVLDRSQLILDLAAANKVPAPNPADVNRAQVSTWIETQLTAAAADDLGVTVTDSDIDRFLDQVAQQSSVTREQFETQFAVQQGSWVPPSVLESFARTYLQQQAIAAKLVPNGTAEQKGAALNAELSKVAAEQGVTVSPRYGSWDPKAARVVDPANDLSAPPRLSTPEVTSDPSTSSQG